MKTRLITLLAIVITSSIVCGQKKGNEELVSLQLEKLQLETQFKIDTLKNSTEIRIHQI